MKNGIFGKENDIPIQKKYEKSISDDIDIDLGDDISLDKDNINKKEDDYNKKFNKDNNDNIYLDSDSEKNKSSSNEEKEKKEIIDKQQQIEDILINSIKNKENATSQNIQMAEEINFKTIPDKLIATDEYGFIIDKKSEENNQKEKRHGILPRLFRHTQ